MLSLQDLEWSRPHPRDGYSDGYDGLLAAFRRRHGRPPAAEEPAALWLAVLPRTMQGLSEALAWTRMLGDAGERVRLAVAGAAVRRVLAAWEAAGDAHPQQVAETIETIEALLAALRRGAPAEELATLWSAARDGLWLAGQIRIRWGDAAETAAQWRDLEAALAEEGA